MEGTARLRLPLRLQPREEKVAATPGLSCLSLPSKERDVFGSIGTHTTDTHNCPYTERASERATGRESCPLPPRLCANPEGDHLCWARPPPRQTGPRMPGSPPPFRQLSPHLADPQQSFWAPTKMGVLGKGEQAGENSPSYTPLSPLPCSGAPGRLRHQVSLDLAPPLPGTWLSQQNKVPHAEAGQLLAVRLTRTGGGVAKDSDHSGTPGLPGNRGVGAVRL